VGHLNNEERNLLVGTCLDYQDILYLPGCTVSSMGAMHHLIYIKPETKHRNTRSHTLPESQRLEIEKHAEKLLKKGIIEESNSPRRSPIMVVAKKMEASRK
jgi:hypothetical protein